MILEQCLNAFSVLVMFCKALNMQRYIYNETSIQRLSNKLFHFTEKIPIKQVFPRTSFFN